jgi:hypothetical protein
VCEGCERCLTPTAWRHLQRLGEAKEAKNQLHRIVRFLEQQFEVRIGLAKTVLDHHCNHPNVIPHYSEWWREGRLPDNYFCRVCRVSLSPQELLTTYERTRREREVTRGGETAPTGEETSERPTRRARRGSPAGSSGGGGTQP